VSEDRSGEQQSAEHVAILASRAAIAAASDHSFMRRPVRFRPARRSDSSALLGLAAEYYREEEPRPLTSHEAPRARSAPRRCSRSQSHSSGVA
jgi:hypothetical protein